MILRVVSLLLAAVLPMTAADCYGHARDLSNLIAPAKLATLGPRGANPRIQKAVALLEDARRDGCAVSIVASNAVFIAGYTNSTLAQMTRDALTRNHGIAEKLGALTDVGLDDMRRGQAATIKRGPYAGDELSVDHIVPFSVASERGQRHRQSGTDAAADERIEKRQARLAAIRLRKEVSRGGIANGQTAQGD